MILAKEIDNELWVKATDCEQAISRAVTDERKQVALDKKAENARELGLDYEPAQKRPQNCGTGYCSCIECVMEPAQQESVTWRNAAIRVGEDLCSVGPFGYYDMTAEQWLDWALSVVTVHAPPAQRTWVGLTTKEIREWWASENGLEDCLMAKLDDFEQVARAIETKLKEKNT